MKKVENILFAGVGGQGVVLASGILAKTAFDNGYDVKDSELHGMAQRGGSVVSHVRYGDIVHSPLIPKGKADFLVATEELEGERYASFVKPGGIVILNKRRTIPVTVNENCPYPENVKGELEAMNLDVLEIDASEISKKLGSSKVENIVLIGALSSFLSLSLDKWRNAIKEMVPPKTIDINLKAFEEGREIAKNSKKQLS